jgi:Ca2+-binding RTX toxin-like protein
MRGSVLAAAVLSSLLVAGASTAARIVGSNHGETLRGTTGADRIYGKSGRDTLLGLAGDDELYPGPGADVVRCGAGRDTVHADWADTIARDCERVVHTTPAAVDAFAGTSTQNEAVTLDVLAAGRTLTRFRINSVNQSCTPANELATFGALDFGDTVFPIAKSGAFRASYAGPGMVDGYAAQLDVRVSGRLAGRSASGTARVDTTFAHENGTAFACSSGDVGWSAALP